MLMFKMYSADGATVMKCCYAEELYVSVYQGDTLIHDVFDVGAAVADLLAPVDRRQRTNTADDGR